MEFHNKSLCVKEILLHHFIIKREDNSNKKSNKDNSDNSNNNQSPGPESFKHPNVVRVYRRYSDIAV